MACLSQATHEFLIRSYFAFTSCRHIFSRQLLKTWGQMLGDIGQNSNFMFHWISRYIYDIFPSSVIKANYGNGRIQQWMFIWVKRVFTLRLGKCLETCSVNNRKVGNNMSQHLQLTRKFNCSFIKTVIKFDQPLSD